MAGKKGVSDRTLQRKWRKAVLLAHGNRCVICGLRKPDSELECHHIIPRRKRVLRHDHYNGVPVCVGECHQKAHTEAGKLVIWDEIGHDRRDRLLDREGWLVKDHRDALSFSKAEHEEWENARLEAVIKSYTPE